MQNQSVFEACSIVHVAPESVVRPSSASPPIHAVVGLMA